MATKRKLLGRPLLLEGKRTKKIDTRFTEEEYSLILALEKELGISKTDLVRSRLLNNAPTVLVNAKEVMAILETIGVEMARSGNNINQLAKYANILNKRGKLSPVIMERYIYLFENYNSQQKELAIALRKIIRIFGH